MIQKPEHAESHPVVFIVDDDESMRRAVSDPVRGF
jgi:FixJ family two-component response regulator